MKITKRSVALLVAIALLIGCAAGGTMAWLMDKTTAVTNTFTVGNIDITLTESDADVDIDGDGDIDADDKKDDTNNNSYKMVPGTVLPKDPTVTVAANSEDCWLFVKVEKNFETIATYNFIDFLSYSVDTNWTQGNGGTGDIPKNVYYRQVSASASAQSYGILAENKVTVPSNVTKAMMDAFDTNGDGTLQNTEKAGFPQLIFTAYAHQVQNGDSTFDAKTAWNQVKDL